MDDPHAVQLRGLLEDVVHRADIGICIVNVERQIVYWNRFMQINSGLAPDQVLQKDLFACFPDLGRWVERKIESAILLGQPVFSSWEQRPYLFRFPSRRTVVGGLDHMAQNCTFMPLRRGEAVDAVCLMVHDTTDSCIYQKKLETALAQVREMAIRDELTKVFNRRHIEELLRVEFARAKRYRSPFALLVVDIDFFKKVNDEHGHLAGDAVLRHVAQRISGSLRSTDAVGRYGGEELLVLFPGVGEEGGCVGAERLRRTIEEAAAVFGGRPIPVTISVGVAGVHDSDERPEDMFGAADRALYLSKSGGRNRVTCANRPVGPGDDAKPPAAASRA